MKKFNFLGTLFALVCVMLLTACEAEMSLPEKTLERPVTFYITNNQGQSTAEIHYNGYIDSIFIDLDKKVIKLENKADLSSATLLGDDPKAVDGTNHNWSDSQVSRIKIRKHSGLQLWLINDGVDGKKDGLSATMAQKYQLWYKTPTMTEAQMAPEDMCPWYIQSATDDDDIVIVKTDTTFTITTTVSSSSVNGVASVKYPTVEVDKAQLGKVTFLNEEKTTSPLPDGFVLAVAQKFNDSQVATVVATCRHDSEAKAWVEVTEIKYVTYYPTLSANIADIKLKEVITWEGRGTLAGRTGEIDLYPTYRQVAKPTDDEILLTITNGGLTGKATAKASISDAEATATINLKKDNIQVDPGVIGTKPSFTVSSALQLSDYSANGKTGKKGQQTWTGTDTQVAESIVQWLKSSTAENYEEISVGNPTVSVSVTVAGKSDKVTLTFPVTVTQKGELPKTKSGNVLVTYTRQAKEDVYTVTERTWPDQSGSSMLQYTELKVFKNGSEISHKQFRSAACGVITGVTELYVSNTSVTKDDSVRDDTSPDWTGTSTSTDGVVTYEFTKNSKIHHFTRSFTSDAGGKVNAIDGEYRFMTSTITVKVNGKVLKTITFTPSTTITVDKLEQVSGVPTQKVASGHTYTYAGSWHLVITNTINGDKFHESDCKPILWKY